MLPLRLNPSCNYVKATSSSYNMIESQSVINSSTIMLINSRAFESTCDDLRKTTCKVMHRICVLDVHI